MDNCNHNHYVDGDDENFLLDDDNIGKNECIRCRKQEKPKPTLALFIDDRTDHLEDSPLLINDLYVGSAGSDFHCHDSLEDHTEDVNAWRKLMSASVLCFLFMAAELIGGYLAGSLAIMTDAAHMFSDFIGFLISLLAIWVGRKPPTKHMTFGYYRAEVIGALLSVVTIWLLAAVFSTLAINRLFYKDYEIEANTMIIIASVGLAINIAMGGILHGVCHGHSHGLSISNHGHGHADKQNINVRAAAAHVLGDLLQSVGVLLAAVIIKFFPNAKIADPICTLVFSLIVICTTLRVGRDSLWFLIEGSPVNAAVLANELKQLSSVEHIHSVHIWSLAPGKDAVAVHLAVDNYCDRDLLLRKATTLIRNQISVVSCTVQIEAYNPEKVNSCRQCQILLC